MVLSRILTLFITLLMLISHVESSSQSHTLYIKNSCKTTTYSSICRKTLLPYASTVKSNPVKLCRTALNVAISSTSNCSVTVSKFSNRKGLASPEAMAMKECISDMKDAVYELKLTVSAMGHLKGKDREYQWANAKTYASAAITDAETCVDGFLGMKVNASVKKRIKKCVSDVEKLMSNALSLINHLY